ncbi:MAG: bifunctional molybdenum cofactor biosynthesis protein MoaC/MoaB [Rhizobiales bacterium]|nr:bifunctional molybdenum cofactor biosynthesis protein MoaC/MoaB [Hyphomicrobiales bacterium]NRB15403.1 bifunctional molybdenum cofactor biosynthesis protein MoaC/MoaB [Hyphomicrobiales bacterium]
MSKSLNSFFDASKYHMADISHKAPTFRQAITMGRIYVREIGFENIKNETLPKGDVLKLAEIAGVQGAKNCWQQIPMCHPLLLDHVAIYLELEPSTLSVAAYAIVSTTAKTGVEMEALAAVNAALLTLYDLTKPVEPALEIGDVRLLVKKGGKKGLWVHPDGIPEKLQSLLPTISERPMEAITAAVVTMSDRASKGEYADRSGVILSEKLEFYGAKINDYKILPDDPEPLTRHILALIGQVDVIFTTGGTGLAPRDITIDTIAKIADYDVPGIGELLRSSAAAHVPTTWISRSNAYVIKDTLIVCLPGSTGGVKDGIETLKNLLPHAIGHVQNKNMHG